MKPSTLTATRAALLAVLRDVPGLGIVHDRERYADSNTQFHALYRYTHTDPATDAFGGDAHIRGWYVRRAKTAETNTNGRILNDHLWQIRGFLSFKDAIASELIFDDLLERIRDAVRMDATLGLPGLVGASVAQERGGQVASVGPVLFAGALCHSAVIEVTTRNWVDWRK